MLESSKTLLKTAPDDEERLLIHDLFLETMDPKYIFDTYYSVFFYCYGEISRSELIHMEINCSAIKI